MKFPRAVEGEGVVELRHFNKYFKNTSKTQQKKAPQRNILNIFLLDTLKTIFSMENLTQTLKQSGLFFLRLGHLFDFQKGHEKPLL